MTETASPCPQCGGTPRDTARFCDTCGAPLTVINESAEYKQVTVLFADVVRSMDMAEALGPERTREVMADLVNRSSAIVRRFGGTVNQFTGDGIMALFGAPQALEDHARRACLAAFDIQTEASRLAAEVASREGLSLQLRVGLNSGEVVAGDVGSGAIAYTAVGQHVGMAQRMESVCPPGGVMLSQSTARLVEDEFILGDAEFVRIKGADSVVAVRRLLGTAGERRSHRRESRHVGREREIREIVAALDQSLSGDGTLVVVNGPPGIGKTRLTREAVAAAQERGFAVFSTYCESHTREIAFNVVSRLLRSVFGVGGLAADVARTQVRGRIVDAADEDLLLLDDLIGIRDPDVPLPDFSPDARHRRLVDLINTVAVARQEPAIYVLEDAHWIDAVSESMLADFAEVVPRMRATALVTYRPEYSGQLSRITASRAITLAPLSDSQIAELIGDMLGADSSVRRLSSVVTDRAGGIPFFAEEIVRDLAERGELEGDRGAYVCVREVEDVDVPATLQAAIGARIDRLTPVAKRTLHAAAVIGSRFGADLLNHLSSEAQVQPLIEAELVDLVPTSSRTEYSFRHPLIQKVAYESQLKSARSDLHRRVAALMKRSVQDATGTESAFIATQYEAAGDLPEAFDWYMRAATWYGARGIRAARGSWELARRVADQLPEDHPDRLGMRIAPRALMCGSAFTVGGTPADSGFDELRKLTTEAGDKKSLVVGMTGHIATLTFNSHYREAADMASEFAALVDSLGDTATTVGLLWPAAQAKWEAGQATESLRLAQHMIDLADGDLTMGNFLVASPLALAIMLKGASGMFLGRPGWRRDVEDAAALAQSFDATTRALGGLYKYVAGPLTGALIPGADDVRVAAESLEIAERDGDPTAVTYSLLNRAVALIHSPAGDRAAGAAVLIRAREMIVRERLTTTLRRMCDIELAREMMRDGDLDGAIEMAKIILDEQFDTGEMILRGPATTVLVETLLRRDSETDQHEARQAIDRLAAVPTDPGFVLHDLPILRLRALLARASGDEPGYQQFLARFRAKAQEADFEGCVAQADAMV
jgi:adenylate cyclase